MDGVLSKTRTVSSEELGRLREAAGATPWRDVTSWFGGVCEELVFCFFVFFNADRRGALGEDETPLKKLQQRRDRTSSLVLLLMGFFFSPFLALSDT